MLSSGVKGAAKERVILGLLPTCFEQLEGRTGLESAAGGRDTHLHARAIGWIELERQLTRSGRDADLLRAVRHLLDALRKTYDLILVDCSPGLYLSTESWLQACDYQLAPIKADKISLSALGLVLDFRRACPGGTVSSWLGIVVNSYQENDAANAILGKLQTFTDLKMFSTIVPATLALQRLAIHHGDRRSYHAKYPGASGQALRQLSKEFLARMTARSASALTMTRVSQA